MARNKERKSHNEENTNKNTAKSKKHHSKCPHNQSPLYIRLEEKSSMHAETYCDLFQLAMIIHKDISTKYIYMWRAYHSQTSYRMTLSQRHSTLSPRAEEMALSKRREKAMRRGKCSAKPFVCASSALIRIQEHLESRRMTDDRTAACSVSITVFVCLPDQWN